MNGSSKPLGAKIPSLYAEPQAAAMLKRLDITQKEIDKCPKITPILSRALKGRGGEMFMARVIDYLRFSSERAAINLVEAYDNCNAFDLTVVTLEMLCVAAKVNPAEILGITLMCARQLSAQESALTTVLAHPEVVESTIEYAKNLPGASKDREMLHQAVGFLPTTKGVSMNVNLMGGSPTFSSAEESGDDEESFADAFPSISEKIDEWSDRRHKLLEGGK